jgi:hypothetical protein
MKRTPLTSKSINIQPIKQTSPIKRSESPTKSYIFNKSPTKRIRTSPTKSISKLSFTIYQDSTPITTPLIHPLSNTSISADKENEYPQCKRSKLIINPHNRKPLQDINITLKPGYLHEGSDPLTPLSQMKPLNEPWMQIKSGNSNRLTIPSYITPPKRTKVKYVNNLNSSINKNLNKQLQYAKDDMNLKNIIKEEFHIHHD